MDSSVSYDGSVDAKRGGAVAKVIPHLRCALARHFGSRRFNAASVYLAEVWLPQSGEVPDGSPSFFHYVNVRPAAQEHE